jgi:hypothetical protein
MGGENEVYGINSAAIKAVQQVMQPQIDTLGERMDKGFSELKDILRGYEERTRLLETKEAACQPNIQNQLGAAWRRIDEHEATLKNHTKIVTEMASAINLLMWVGGLGGTALGLWFIAQIVTLIK